MKEVLDRLVREIGIPNVLKLLVEQCTRMGSKERQLAQELQHALDNYKRR